MFVSPSYGRHSDPGWHPTGMLLLSDVCFPGPKHVYHTWAGGHLTLQFNPSKLVVFFSVQQMFLMLDIPKSSNAFWAKRKIDWIDVHQHRATPEQTRHSPVGTLQPRCWEHETSSLLHFFGRGPKNIYRVYHGHHNGSNGPIYINNICGHFDISDHMSSPLAMVRIIMGWSGPKSTASLWACPLLRIPFYPWQKNAKRSSKNWMIWRITGLRTLLI